jgi:hypothetical protein
MISRQRLPASGQLNPQSPRLSLAQSACCATYRVEALATQRGSDKARPQTSVLVAPAALVSPRVVRNNHFDARVVVRQCRQLSYHQECIGIAGSRGVRLSSPTEQDDRE